MTNALLQIKFKERLNKLASMDYDNIECWQIQEAFNKAQIEWTRRMLNGLTSKKENPEQSVNMIDNLQVLLTDHKFNSIVKRTRYYETETIPSDYLAFIRVSGDAVTECCKEGRALTVYLGEEANVESLLGDSYKSPNFEWSETFCTIIGNKIRIYTDSKFDVVDSHLIYYRKPKNVGFANCANIDDGGSYPTDEISEFKDDIVEIIIDEAVAILAGDVADITNYQRNLGNSTRNT
jgi:hypothetical protein